MRGGTAHVKDHMQALRDIWQRLGGQRCWKAAGFAALVAVSVAAPGPLGANGERTIALYNVHTKETLRIVYKRNGRYLPSALKKLNWLLRDWRRNEPTKMDPRLIDLVWEIHTELGSRVPVHVISGYRSKHTNNLLRKTRGGQARRSQHLLGRAMDVRFPDIPVRRLRYSALLREQGGVGYYPTSATPFVHIDTGRVRHWPRMGRQELALLFPSGRTQHRPRGGGPITRQDVIKARASNPRLAQRVAAFHVLRRNGPVRGATRVAAATPRPRLARSRLSSPPRLVRRPQLASLTPRLPRTTPSTANDKGGWSATLRATAPTRVPRPVPARIAPRPEAPARGRPLREPKPQPFKPPSYAISSIDRSGLAQLASALFNSAQSQLRKPVTRATSPRPDEWISAPAFDEEHPEELFYRPFPIAPYITQTASADDPALQELKHPNIDQTLKLLVADGADDPTLQLRPQLATANLLWSQSFRGAKQASPELTAEQRQASALLDRRPVRLAGTQ